MIASAIKSGVIPREPADKPEAAVPVVEWRQPFDFLRDARREVGKNMAWMAMRITGYVLFLGLVFYWIVTIYFPALPGRVINVAWIALGGGTVLFWLSAALQMLPSKGQLYRATENGIEGAGREGGTLHWKWVKAFAVKEDEDYPGVRFLVLYTSHVHPKRIALPEGESAEAVIASVGKHVKPIVQCPDVAAEFAAPMIPMTIPLFVAMLVATAVGSIGLGWFMRNVVTDRELRQLIAAATLIAGPAFWQCLLVYGKRLYRREGSTLWCFIFVFNHAAMALTVLAYALF